MNENGVPADHLASATHSSRTHSVRTSLPMLLVFAMLVSAVFVAASTLTKSEVADAGVFFNDTEFTYKEYWAPHSTFTGGCHADALPPGAFYVEPVDCTKEIGLPIADDVSHAIAAVVYVDLWRNKTSNTSRFTINDGPQYRPPVGWDYSRTVFSATVPISQLRQGNNSIKFQEASGPYHVHDVMIRVYYDNARPLIAGPNSDVVPPNGQLLSVQAGAGPQLTPAAGGVLQVDGNQVTLTASASGAAYVEFHAFYEGYDEDNDGVTHDWHNFLRNNFGTGGVEARTTGATIGHIGTDASADAQGRYSVTWNLPHIVNQSGVRFKVRIVDAKGNAREVAGGVSADFTLERTYQVESFVIPNFRDQGLYFRGMLPQLHADYIDLPNDLVDVDRAFVMGNYWNSPDLSFNGQMGFQVFQGAEDQWATSLREIDPALLLPGRNTLQWTHRAPGFGSMIEKPGPMVIIHRHTPTGMPVITVQPEDVLIPAGEAATLRAAASGAAILQYQWYLDANPIVGATSATYTTPALLASDDGSIYSVTVTNGLGSATSNDARVNVAASPDANAPWWNTTWDYRVPLTVFPEAVERHDKVVEQAINFSDVMADVGAGGPTFDANSIRVVEVDPNGVVIDPAVPFQFDRANDYDPVSKASGTIVWQLVGTTPADEGRTYHIYFDKTSKAIPAAIVPSQITRSAAVDEGFASIQFNMSDGSRWIFHGNHGGGFSKVIDRTGVEWVGWNPAEGSAGDFRGVPNAVKPPAGFFHPGRKDRTKARIVSEGPLKIRMEVQSFDLSWISVWDMYPSYGDFTVTRGNKEFWFLYEGIPGGEVDAADFVQFAEGPPIAYDGVFEGDMPDEEWAYAADPGDGRSFFVAHHENDGSVESYRLLDGVLPILGFGRGGLGLNEPLLSKKVVTEPQNFTVGLVDETAYGPTGDHIRGAYKEVLISVGAGEFDGVRDGAITDDFSAATLNPMWSYVDSLGDTSLTLTGSELSIALPVGTEHSTWNGVDHAPRLVQPIGDTDLDIVVKFESLPTRRFQGQGLLLMEDDQNWVRLVADHDGTRARVLIQSMVDGHATLLERMNLPGVSTRFLRIIRTGDTFTFQRGYDGLKWFPFDSTQTIPLDLTQAGIVVLNSAGATSPAYTSVIDYFESKTTGGLNDDAPIISNVNVVTTARNATITWDTNVPASTILEWGSTISMAHDEDDVAQVTQHVVKIDYLRCDAPYFFRPQSASVIGATITPQVTFRTDVCPTIVSDDFSTGSLGSHWRYVDPSGDSHFTMSTTSAIVSVPAGTEHNLFPGENLAPRFRQEAPVGNFSVDAKFESVLSSRFQMQGIVVEQDDTNYLRFEIHYDGTQTRAYIASIIDNVATVHSYSVLPNNRSQYLRVSRVGNVWTVLHSIDGVSWTPIDAIDVGLDATYVGPYIGATEAGSAVPPAFIGSIDYFFATSNPIVPEDGGAGPDVAAPLITNVQTQVGVPHAQAITLNWTTNEPATTRVDWGFNTGYAAGPLIVNAAVLSHSMVIEPLNCGATYQMRVSSNDASGNTGQSPNLVVVAPPCPAGAFSDNFDSATLDSRWWLDEPRRDTVVGLPSGLLSLTVPGGSRHDITRTVNTAPRMLQRVPNSSSFQVAVGFESVVNFQSQLQGIVFEQDDENLIRFDLFSDGTDTFVFVGQRTANNLTTRATVQVPGATPGALRVTRNGVNWQFEYSPDRGHTWQSIYNGVFTFSLARVGPWVGNGNPQATNTPQHTALIDYFWASSDPIVITEPQSLQGPQFEIFGSRGPVWDGLPLEFGAPGLTQPDINIRGRVTDPDGIAALTYAVNGGQPYTMGVGTTTCPEGGISCTRRLALDGDFNADIDTALLNPGLNTVVIRAIDKEFHLRSVTVPVEFTPGNAWPLPYSVDWSTVTDINDVAQPIDGRWFVEGDHATVSEIGYDRLLSVGDASWQSFEAEVPITINSVDPRGAFAPSGGAAVGFIPHWRGHSQVGTTQPGYGFAGQLGALVWYRYRDDQNGERLEIRDSTSALVAEDLSTRTLQKGVTYIFKLQVETGGGAGPLYRLKVWPQGTPEPSAWDIVTSLPPGSPDSGSLALVAHHVDADFGNINVRQITAGAPAIQPTPGAYSGLAKIEMTTDTRVGEIRYTLDGSEPTEASPLYIEPFFLLEPSTIRARTFRAGFIPSTISESTYDIQPGPNRVEHDLQALYRFDEDGGNTVRDSSFVGAPLDLVIEPGSNTTWLPDADALRINGPSIIRTPGGASRLNTAVVANQSITVEAWIDPTTLDLGNGTLFNIASQSPGQQNVELTQQGRSLDINVRTSNTNSDGVVGRNTGSVLQPQLHHLVWVRRPDNMNELYIDGKIVWTNTVNGSFFPWANGYGLAIGNSVEGVNPWIGDMYLLAVYSDDLTAAEVTNNYHAGPFGLPANYAPQVSAGPDITLVEGEVAVMNATASDDGHPTPPSTLSANWTQISGPGTAYIENPASPTTPVHLPSGGAYVFRWTGSDSEKTSVDEMTITAIAAGSQAPAPDVTPVSAAYPGVATVTMSTAVPGAAIHYTVDGSPPTVASPVYSGPFDITTTSTIQAFVVRTGLADSAVTVRQYTITIPARVTAGIVAYYPFNEPSGASIKDKGGVGSPLNLTVQNTGRMTRLPSGVRLDQPTLILSDSGAAKINNAVKLTNEVTVELWLTPADMAQVNSMILGISANGNARNIALAQQNLNGAAYLRTRATNTKGEPPTVAAGALLPQYTHFVYTRNALGTTTIYVNGVAVVSGVVGDNLGNWISGQSLHLGGELDGTRAWLGTYYLMAFYNRALSPDEVTQNYAFGDV